MIITLCGSARFEEQWVEWNRKLTLQGHVVFSLCSFPRDNDGDKTWYTEKEKILLDEIHKKKIDLSDAIFVLDHGGYVGESTLSEINHARDTGKTIYYMTQEKYHDTLAS